MEKQETRLLQATGVIQKTNSGLGMAKLGHALGIALSQPLLVPEGFARAVKHDQSSILREEVKSWKMCWSYIQ